MVKDLEEEALRLEQIEIKKNQDEVKKRQEAHKEKKRLEREAAAEDKAKKAEARQALKESLPSIALDILNEADVTMSLSGMLEHSKALNYSAEEKLSTSLEATISKYKHTISKEQLELELRCILSNERSFKHKKVVEYLKFNPLYKQYAEDTLRKIVLHFREEKSISSIEMDIKAFHQFFYQVKAKLINEVLVVDNPLCLIIYGAQKIGKSRLVESIKGPVEGLFTEAKTSELSSSNYEKNISSLASSYIVYFDDLTKLDEDHVGHFKSFVTSTKVYYRPYFTQSRSAKSNVSTTIASTNLPLSDIIYDDTGSRRFYQFTAKLRLPEKLSEFYSALKDIDYEKLWQGIDENNKPINEQDFEVIQEYQRIWGTNSTIHNFMYDNPNLCIKDDVKFDANIHEKIDLNKIQKLLKLYINYYGIKLKFISNSRIIDIFNRENYSIQGLGGAALRMAKILFIVDRKEYSIAQSKYISNVKEGNEV